MKYESRKKAILLLKDGTQFEGKSIGIEGRRVFIFLSSGQDIPRSTADSILVIAFFPFGEAFFRLLSGWKWRKFRCRGNEESFDIRETAGLVRATFEACFGNVFAASAHVVRVWVRFVLWIRRVRQTLNFYKDGKTPGICLRLASFQSFLGFEVVRALGFWNGALSSFYFA